MQVKSRLAPVERFSPTNQPGVVEVSSAGGAIRADELSFVSLISISVDDPNSSIPPYE
ncbi:MAG: hypothetical protein Q8T09_08570 [Candidatus Melainabacteria bacterium]|nr:hypothetical protein [Candidatus Melainabacteria bacterium]